MFFVTEALIFVATFLLFSTILSGLRNARRKSLNSSSPLLPPSIPSLPLIGSLPFLGSIDQLPKYLTAKSRSLGPVFTFYIGRRPCIVLNSRDVIAEALVKNSLTFAGRETFTLQRYGNNPNAKGIVFMNFGANFKKYHQLSLSVLREFGFGNKNLMESRILTEVEALVDDIKKKDGEIFNPKNVTSQATSNIIFNIILGYRREYQHGIDKLAFLMQNSIEHMEPIFDVAPFLRHLPYFKQKFQALCKTADVVMKLIDERLEEAKQNSDTTSFVTRYLEKVGPDYDEEQLLFTVRDFLGAGTTTSASTLCWSYVFMANHPEIQKLIQQEIDSVVPITRLPSLQDKAKLAYTEATILELMRIRSIAALAVPHLTLGNSEVGGYLIPAGTMVLPNLYAAHNDPSLWNDPQTFRPERFLDQSKKIVGRENVIPFSLGRRSCMGEELASQEVFLFFAGLLQNFVILPPHDQQLIDDSEVFRTVLEPNPFEIRMIPRSRS